MRRCPFGFSLSIVILKIWPKIAVIFWEHSPLKAQAEARHWRLNSNIPLTLFPIIFFRRKKTCVTEWVPCTVFVGGKKFCDFFSFFVFFFL